MPGCITMLRSLAAVLAALAGVPSASAIAPHRHLLQVGDGSQNNTLAPGVSGLLLQPTGTSQGAYGSFLGVVVAVVGAAFLLSCVIYIIFDRTRRRRQRAHLNATGTGSQAQHADGQIELGDPRPPSKPPVIIVQPNHSLVYGLRVSMDKGGSACLPPEAGGTQEEEDSQDPQQQDPQPQDKSRWSRQVPFMMLEIERHGTLSGNLSFTQRQQGAASRQLGMPVAERSSSLSSLQQVYRPASGALLHRPQSSYKSGRLEESDVPHKLQAAEQRSNSLASTAPALPGSVPALRNTSVHLGEAGATSEAQQPSARESSVAALDEGTIRVRGRNPSASVLGTSQSDVMDNSQSLSGMPMLSHTEPTTISSTAAASGLSTSTSSRWISPFASYSLTPAGNSDTEEVAEGTGPPITRSPVEHH